MHLDVKLPGYEQEVVDAVERHGLDGARARLDGLRARRRGALAALAPALPRAIGYPRDRLGVSRAPLARRPDAGRARPRCGGDAGPRAAPAAPVARATCSRCTTRSARAPPSRAAHALGVPVLALDGQRPGRRAPARRARRRRDRLGRPRNGLKRWLHCPSREAPRSQSVSFVLGLALAGAFSGTVIADITTSTSATTTTGDDDRPTTTTAATTTAVTTTTTPPPGPPPTIPAGVRVAGVKVGGLTPADAVTAVQTAFSRPLAVVVDRSRLVLDPRLFSSAYVEHGRGKGAHRRAPVRT